MADRKGHGRGAGSRRIEVLPVNETPVGVLDLRGPVHSPKLDQLRSEIARTETLLAATKRDPNGRPVTREGKRLLSSLGGLVRSERSEVARLEAERVGVLAELATELLPGMLVADPDFETALPKVLDFVAVESASLAKDVGGGELPAGPASMLVSAALQLVASRVLFARGEFKTASALANDSRQNLMACHDYAAKRALARPASSRQLPWLTPESNQ